MPCLLGRRPAFVKDLREPSPLYPGKLFFQTRSFRSQHQPFDASVLLVSRYRHEPSLHEFIERTMQVLLRDLHAPYEFLHAALWMVRDEIEQSVMNSRQFQLSQPLVRLLNDGAKREVERFKCLIELPQSSLFWGQ